MGEPAQTISDQEQLILSANHSLSLRVLPGTLIYVVLFIINVYANSYHLQHPVLVYTAGSLLILFGLYRLALFIWFEQLHQWNSRIWRAMFYFGTLGVAAIWNLAWSLAIIQDGLITTTNLSIMMTIGITGAGVATLAPDRQLVIYYLLLMFFPTPIAIILSGASEGLAMLSMFMIGALFLLSVGLRLNKEYWQGLHNLALLDHRARELVIARDAAVVADKAKSEFLAKMSHEVRTPMNGVLGMTELLLNTPLNGRQQHLANSIQNSGQLLLDVINDVLDFSKLNAGKLELERIDFDLRDELEQQIEMFAEPAHRKGIELISHIPGDLPSRVQGDPLRFRQVLANLIGNALKFTEQGEIVIKACAGASSGDLQEYRFEVEDTGTGVPATAQAHIFDSFSQADDSTTRKYGGSGLGLAIAKQLTEMLGGRIGLENPDTGGARFWFTARFTSQQDQDTGTEVDELNSRYRSIMLLAKNAKSRQALQEMLSLPDIKVRIAVNGKDALEMLNQAAESGQPFDAVVIDDGPSDMTLSELIDAMEPLKTSAFPDLLLLVKINAEIDAKVLRTAQCLVKRKPLRRKTLFQFLKNGPQKLHALNAGSRQDNQSLNSPQSPVLLAEDNLINQEIAASMLQILGHQVVIANNGQEALDYLEQGKFSLVLMDCQMPTLDGYQTTQRIRMQEQDADIGHIPIIAMTANALQGDREAALAAGMDDYLSKPFTLEQLSEVLKNWMTDEPAADSLQQLMNPASG